MSTFGSLAALEVSASIEISMPGAMIPPRYSPRSNRVVGDRGPEVHDHAGVPADVVTRDRVHQPVGAELAGVVERIGIPVLVPGPTISASRSR